MDSLEKFESTLRGVIDSAIEINVENFNLRKSLETGKVANDTLIKENADLRTVNSSQDWCINNHGTIIKRLQEEKAELRKSVKLAQDEVDDMRGCAERQSKMIDTVNDENAKLREQLESKSIDVDSLQITLRIKRDENNNLREQLAAEEQKGADAAIQYDNQRMYDEVQFAELRTQLAAKKQQADELAAKLKRYRDINPSEDYDASDEIAELRKQLGDVQFAAHMPDNYEHGLPSWVQQKLYQSYLGRDFSRTVDIETINELRKQLAAEKKWSDKKIDELARQLKIAKWWESSDDPTEQLPQPAKPVVKNLYCCHCLQTIKLDSTGILPFECPNQLCGSEMFAGDWFDSLPQPAAEPESAKQSAGGDVECSKPPVESQEKPPCPCMYSQSDPRKEEEKKIYIEKFGQEQADKINWHESQDTPQADVIITGSTAFVLELDAAKARIAELESKVLTLERDRDLKQADNSDLRLKIRALEDGRAKIDYPTQWSLWNDEKNNLEKQLAECRVAVETVRKIKTGLHVEPRGGMWLVFYPPGTESVVNISLEMAVRLALGEKGGER